MKCDTECKFMFEDTLTDKFICTKFNKDVSDFEGECESFEELCFCSTCKHSRSTIYETGTIDDIEYRCQLQNNKLIYDDSSPYSLHNSDFPECSINRYEKGF